MFLLERSVVISGWKV